jgi:hypothetical protein
MARGLLVLFFFVFMAWGQESDRGQLVTIEVDFPQGIKRFEIHWLKKKTATPDSIAARERVQGQKLQRRIPLSWRFFRVRSISRQGATGPWSSTHPIPKPQKRDKIRGLFRYVQSSAKQKRRFLRGRKLDMDKLAPDKATAYSVNGSDPRKLDRQIHFETDGHYTLQFHHDSSSYGSSSSDSASRPRAKSTTQEEFWVDTTPPKTRIFIYPPFYKNEEGLWVGRNTRFVLKAQDRHAGVEETFYRIPQGEQWQDFQRYSKGFRLGDLSLKGDGLELRYYSRDKLGNSEEVRNVYLQADFEPPQLRLKETTKAKLSWRVEDTSLPVHLSVYQQGRRIDEAKVYGDYTLPLNKLGSGGFILKARDLLGNSATYRGKRRR